MATHAISDSFKKELLSGALKPLLDAVKMDDTLCLELRGTSINIYYRGGSLFRISDDNGTYRIFFDTQYCTASQTNLDGNPSIQQAVERIPMYKQAMDHWFHVHPKDEREFQQLILRENNGGKLARATDYYIIDIEYADSSLGARFDMVALKWPSNGAARKDTSRPSLALIEVKYGDNALGDNNLSKESGTQNRPASKKSGIQDHLSDFDEFLGDAAKVEAFRMDMEKVFQQKCELGLVNGLQEHQYGISLSAEAPEVIFLLANHDPDSKKLQQILAPLRSEDYAFTIRFAAASFMGYGLFEPHMMSLDDLKENLAKK